MSEQVVFYSNENIIYDKVYLHWQLRMERDAMLVTYIEENFDEVSHSYQASLMLQNPYFGNKILDDYELNNDEKQEMFLNNLTNSDKKEGKLVLVDASKGGGKTGFGMWIIDSYRERKPWLNYYFVTKKERNRIPDLPEWIKICKAVSELPNDCVALIDEGAINLNSRRAMTKDNIEASEQLVILRHKGITIIVLVQNVKMVDANVRRTADIRALKFGIRFGSDEGNSKDMKEVNMIRDRLRPRDKTEVYIEIAALQIYIKFQHGLPDWWTDNISKSWANYKPEEKKKEVKQESTRKRPMY